VSNEKLLFSCGVLFLNKYINQHRGWVLDAPILLKNQIPMPEHIKDAIYKPLPSWRENGVPVDEVLMYIFL